MKSNRTRFFWHLALPLWLAAAPLAWAQVAKVAVIGDPSISDLVDVTTVQLSTIPGLSILERSDLDKIGREQSLKEVITSNDVSSVQFVPTDGLVILRAISQNGKIGVFARLVAVQPGIVLREVALSDGADPVAHASEIVKEFAPYWSKLTEIQKGKINALSLLGLRFEVDGLETRAMERKINLLLASRLSAEPDTMVLERWRLNDALFEKTLNPQPSAPFWTGSSLIDGSMKLENKEVSVTLRVRPPSGAEISIADHESVDDLPALVDRLADKIPAHPTTQTTWQPAAEADHYAKLGKWCLDNRLTDEGTEAVESAVALGDDSPETQRMLIRGYASLAFTDELPNAESSYNPGEPKMNPDTVPGRVKWAQTAVDLAGRYLSANQNLFGQPGAGDDPIAVSLPVLDNCLRVLRFAYQIGFARDHADETADLRHAVQNLIGQMEPVLAKKPSVEHDLFLTYEVRYAPYWHETPEATVDYYRELLNRKTDGGIIRTELYESLYFVRHPYCLLPDNGKIANTDWYVASPRILDWDNRPLNELSAIWDNFLKELSGSSDPILQADALKFDFSRALTDSMLDEVENGRIVTLLEQNKQSISGPRGNDLLTGFRSRIPDIIEVWDPVSGLTKLQDGANRDRLCDLGEGLLKERTILPIEWIRLMPVIYHQMPPDPARRVLASLDAYRQWYQTQVPQDPEMVIAMDAARRPLVVYAGTNVQGSQVDAVIVKQHWPVQAVMGNGIDVMRSLPFGPSVIAAENKIWFLMWGGKQIYCIDPQTLQTVAAFKIPDEMVTDSASSLGEGYLAVTPQYLVVSVVGRVMLCSRTDGTWRKLDLPPAAYKPCWVDQQLYLIYDTESIMADYRIKGQGAATAISGLIHISLPDGGIENLISTRRIPPQNALDGKPLGYPLDLWSSSGGLMLAVDADSPHFQVFGTPAGKSDWDPVTTDRTWCDVKAGTGGELVGKGFDEHGFVQIGLMVGNASEVLLANPNRAEAGVAPVARWDIPDEIRTTPPDVVWQASSVMRGDDLCLYRDVMNATKDNFQVGLYYFAKGQKTGLKIPLRFQAQGNQNPILLSRQSAILNYQSLQTTDYGLVVVQAMGGFWVIPWSDIDAYRAHPASAEVAAIPVPENVVAVVAPVQPQASVAPPAPPPVATPAPPRAEMIAPPQVSPPEPAPVPSPATIVKPSRPPVPASAPAVPPQTAPILPPASPSDNRD